MIEGSGSGFRAGSGSGSIPLTSGSRSGSGRPENMWIRIRIRNAGRGLLEGFLEQVINFIPDMIFLHPGSASKYISILT
jgi:hypothetical protein